MYIAIILGIIILAFIIYVHYENTNLEVTHYTINSKDVPKSFQGVHFAVLSDLHNNSFGKDNEILIREIEKVNPDFIIIAGDMIIGTITNDYSIANTLLYKLADKYPIYYSYGNHEQRVTPGGIYQDERFEIYKANLQKLGVHFLVNESITITNKKESICLTGLQIGLEYFKKLKQPKMELQYIQNLVGIPNKQCYNIMIAHNPMYFKNYMEWGADLVLSGHLHGGIVRLPILGGVISPQYKLFPRYDSGIFQEKGKFMLVSRGLGTHTIKVRVFNRPELMVVNLDRPI